jgi:glycosyltransferase involved in cell wall biosynthesis
MNIVQVPRRFVSSHWGGTETVILETCKRLVQRGQQTEILCPNALATGNEEVIGGIRVTRVPYFYPYFGLNREAKALFDRKGGNLFSFALMKTLLKLPDLDVIHLHTAKRVGGIARYAAAKRRIPYVLSLHGGVFDVPQEEAQSWTDPSRGAWEWGKLLGWWVGSRRVLDDAAAILCVGEEERVQTARRYPHKKVIHLPNGVNPDRFERGDGEAFRRNHDIPQEAFVLLTVGRIDPQKNQLLLLRLWPEITKIHPTAHALIIGPVTHEPYYQELLRYMDAHQLAGRVTIIPGLAADSRELVNAYHAANLFVLPSIHEPFGIVILEAWAAGLPVLASRVGGVPSFVDHGQDGLLFDGADEKSFLEGCQALIADPLKARELALAGQRKAREDYSWERITDSLLGIYEEAVRENPLRQ